MQQREAHIGRDLEATATELDDDVAELNKPKVKQEPYADEEELAEQQPADEEEEHSELELSRELRARDEPLAKRPKMELVDAEANTVHTGEQSMHLKPRKPTGPSRPQPPLVVFNCRIAAA